MGAFTEAQRASGRARALQTLGVHLIRDIAKVLPRWRRADGRGPPPAPRRAGHVPIRVGGRRHRCTPDPPLEAGEQQPVLSVAVAIAEALEISVGELAGLPTHGVNLTGDWWAAWQSVKDGHELIAVQPVRMKQQGELIQIEALQRGREIADGGYLWRGELRLWDNEILTGWYASIEPTVRSKVTLYFAIHPKA